MSKTTASAAGGAMPGSGHAADHPDAALFAMAEECIVAARELKKVLDQLEAAEDKHRRIPTPETVLKTERDAQLGLYLGGRSGDPYDEDEIAALRVLCRKLGRDAHPRAEQGRGTCFLR